MQGIADNHFPKTSTQETFTRMKSCIAVPLGLQLFPIHGTSLPLALYDVNNPATAKVPL